MMVPKPLTSVLRVPKLPRRLPERKRMTIAAGFLCRSGIVLCADSQEVVGDMKWPVKKLVVPRTAMGNTRIMIAGAGFGPAIDNATQKIVSRVAMSMMSYNQIIESIESTLREVEQDLQITRGVESMHLF